MVKIHKTNKILFFAFSFLFILALTGCGKDTGEGKIFRYDVKYGTANIDPQFSTSATAKIIIKNTYEGLFGYNENGDFIKVLAEDYTISADKLTYTFTIKDNVKWSNGDLVTAFDFEYAFKRMFNTEAISPYATNYLSIKNAKEILNGEMNYNQLGAVALNNQKLQITLSSPNPYFLKALAESPAMPCNEKFLKDAKGRYGLNDDSVLFNGPFIVTYWDNDSVIKIRKNKYYSSDNQTISAGVNFNISNKDFFDNFLRGYSDAIFIEKEQITQTEDIEATIIPLASTTWSLIFNQNIKPFNNEKVRLAFASSIDYEYKEKLNPDVNSIEKNIVPKIINGPTTNYRKSVGDINYKFLNSINGKEILGEYLKASEINKLTSVTLLLPDNDLGKIIAQQFQKNFANSISVYINFKFLEKNQLINEVKKGNYEFAVVPLSADGDSPVSFLNQFTSYDKNNITGFKDVQYDELLSNSINSNSEKNSLENLFEAEQMLIDKATVLPLYSTYEYFAVPKNTKDIFVSSYDKNCYFKYAKRFG